MYHVGIDPGATGAIALLDGRGGFVACHRWQPKDPARLYQLLLTIKGDILGYIYLEMVNAHPGEGLGHVVRNHSLMVNWGIWQGFCLAAGLSFTLVHPATWQTAHNLRNWQAAAKLDPRAPSPLALARHLWPAAPLEFQADDGKAVALLLANLARQDAASGIDRQALAAVAQVKAKARRKKLREQKQGAAPPPFGPARPPEVARFAAGPPARPLTQAPTFQARQQGQKPYKHLINILADVIRGNGE